MNALPAEKIKRIFAIDPGPEESAWAEWDGRFIASFGKIQNEKMFDVFDDRMPTLVVIEQVAAMGMSVGAEVFETVFWSGRFAEYVAREYGWFERMKRMEVKMHLCGNSRAKDGNVRQSLIDRFGGKNRAIGRKKTPGPLYGVSGDVWQALALGVTFWDLKISVQLRETKGT